MPTPNRPQSWHDCDTDIRQHVEEMVEVLRAELDPNLTGIYLHGSLAMGSFYRPKSDIDVLVVVRELLWPERRRAVAERLAALASTRPIIGFIELSVILATDARSVPAPMPYQVHYSEEWHDRIVAGKVDYASDGTDLDLIAHVTHQLQRGVTLHGTPHHEVFGTPPWSAYLDAVMADFRWLLDGDHVVETPYYAVLNICRTLQLVAEQNAGLKVRVHSKDEGGEWGLSNLPTEHHALISLALAAYRSGAPVTVQRSHFGTVEWDAERLLALRDYARSRLTA